MPFIRIKNLVSKKKKSDPKIKKGCSKSTKIAKNHKNKLKIESETPLDEEIGKYFEILAEAPRDKEILKKMNMQQIRNVTPKDPDEDWRSYNERVAEPAEEGPLFNQEILQFLENLPNEIFPPKSRKMFTIWLGRALTDGGPELYRANTTTIHNDLNHIRDFINGIESSMPKDLWDYDFSQMMDASTRWHTQLASTIPRGDESENSQHLRYNSKNVVHTFSDGFTMVKVDADQSRDYTREEGLECHWVKDETMWKEFQDYYLSKGKQPPHFKMKQEVNDLDIEGCLMGHCVAGYCDAVDSGNTVIYSLRDSKNRSHATIELDLSTTADDYDTRFRTTGGEIKQIKGKGNDVPSDKYKEKIKEFIRGKMQLESYITNSDYLNLLTSEEQSALLRSQELKNLPENVRIEVHSNLVSTYGASDEVLEEILSQEKVPLQVIEQAVENRTISGNIVKKIIQLDLENGWGRQREHIYLHLFNIHNPGGGWMDPAGKRYKEEIAESEKLRSDPEFLAEIWREVVEPHIEKEFFNNCGQIIKFIVRTPNQPISVKEEVLSRILEEDSTQEAFGMMKQEYFDGQLDRYSSQGQFSWGKEFETIVYNLAASRLSRKSLNQIYEFSKTEEGKALIPQANYHLAGSKNIPEFLVQELISQTQESKRPMGTNIFTMLLVNSAVKDSDKIDIMHIVADIQDNVLGDATGNRTYNKIIARRLMSIFNEKDNKDSDGDTVFGPKFSKWILDSGMADWWFEQKANSTRGGQLQLPASFNQESLSPEALNLKDEYYKKFASSESREQELFNEIKDYFQTPGKRDDHNDYSGKFDSHPLASLEKLLDENEFAPWD